MPLICHFGNIENVLEDLWDKNHCQNALHGYSFKTVSSVLMQNTISTLKSENQEINANTFH